MAEQIWLAKVNGQKGFGVLVFLYFGVLVFLCFRPPTPGILKCPKRSTSKTPKHQNTKTPKHQNTKTHIMKNKGLLLTLGFLLFVLGITSIIMTLVGVRWVFLGWLEMGGSLLAFVLKIIMTIAGVLLIVLSRTNWDEERKESSEP